MPYELVAEKVRALPARAVEEILRYIDYIAARCTKDSAEEAGRNEKLDALKGMFGILSDDEADEMRGCCRLRFKEAEA